MTATIVSQHEHDHDLLTGIMPLNSNYVYQDRIVAGGVCWDERESVRRLHAPGWVVIENPGATGGGRRRRIRSVGFNAAVTLDG